MVRIKGWLFVVLSLTLIAAVLAIGLLVIWPLHFYPITEFEIDYRAPLAVSDKVYSEDRDSVAAGVVAGVAIRDITPPIGMPKFGYSTWAKVATGFRTRLKARAFYLQSTSGRALAIVQTDLGSGSLLLHHAAAGRLSESTPIGFANLSITPTHTHSGPGQYFSNDFYNTFGSSKPGFDPALFEFLVTQIVEAVKEAYQNRAEAQIAIGERDVYGLSVNRSIDAYLNNESRQVSREQAASLDDHALPLRAVNPRMTMIRIDHRDGNGQFKPKGVITSFAIHGTGIGADDTLYHSDVWAQFSHRLVWKIKQHYATEWLPVHGPFEANHGDNNPAYAQGRRGVVETDRIGAALADEAWQLLLGLEGRGKSDIDIDTAAVEVDLLSPKNEQHQAWIKPLCPRALLGCALAAGATGDEVFPISYIFPFKKGYPHSGENLGCHQQKRILLTQWIQPMIFVPERFPHRVYFQMQRIDNFLMFHAPYEITLEAGNRIEQSIEQVLARLEIGGAEEGEKESEKEIENVSEKRGVEYISVNSIANGFTGYATTREEYALQWYEGGHTLYGPGTTGFIRRVASHLTERLISSDDESYIDLPQRWQFKLRSHQYFPTSDGKGAEKGRQAVGEVVYYRTSSDTLHDHHYGSVDNVEGVEGVDGPAGRWVFDYFGEELSELELNQPLLSIEYLSREGCDDGQVNTGVTTWCPLIVDGIPVDDQGGDLSLEYIDPLLGLFGKVRYRASWYAAVDSLEEGVEYRFRIEPRKGAELFHSSVFSR